VDAILARVEERLMLLPGNAGYPAVAERLYREIRALRIYEGASEVLKLIIGSKTLEAAEQRTSVPASSAPAPTRIS